MEELKYNLHDPHKECIPFMVILSTHSLHLYLSGVLLGVDFKNAIGHQKDMCLRGIGLHVQHLLTTLGSIINTKERGGGELTC